MRDCSLLDRLTLTGWLLLIGSAAGLVLGGSPVWAALSPATLAQCRGSGRVMALIFAAALTLCVVAGGFLLHAAGIAVLRPRRPQTDDEEDLTETEA